MNCLFHAFRDYLDYTYGSNGAVWVSDVALFQKYRLIRKYYGHKPNDPSSGLIAPLLALAIQSDLDHPCRIKVQNRIWTPAHYRAADNGKYTVLVDNMVEDNLFGDTVDKITLAPAIYLSLSEQHAFFNVRVPKNHVIVMAIQICTPVEYRSTRRKILWQIKKFVSQLAR